MKPLRNRCNYEAASAFEQFNLAVNREHLLHECAPKVQEPWNGRSASALEGLPFLFEELAETRT